MIKHNYLQQFFQGKNSILIVSLLLSVRAFSQTLQSFTFVNQTKVGFIPTFAVIKEEKVVANLSGSIVIVPAGFNEPAITTPYILSQFFWFAPVENRMVINHGCANNLTLKPSSGSSLILSLNPNKSYAITLIDQEGTIKAILKEKVEEQTGYNNMLRNSRYLINHTQTLAPTRATPLTNSSQPRKQ